MKLKVEKIENAKADIFISLTGKEFAKHLEEAFNQEVQKVEASGFRKGKMPKAIFMKKYGEESLYPTASDLALNDVYPKLITKNELDVVASPEFDWMNAKISSEGLEVSGTVELMPEIEVGDYELIKKGIKKGKSTVTAADIDAEISILLKDKSTYDLKTEGTVENNDTVIFDFEGFIDGVAFDGGKAENHELVIGSNSFIPGFEEQLIGMSAGDDKDVKVNFPDDYHAENLKGKEAIFKCKIHEIKTLMVPAITEELLKELEYDVKTEDEFKKVIKKDLKTKKDSEVLNDYNRQIFTAIIEDCNFTVPKAMIKQETDITIENFKKQISTQGIDFETYMSMLGMNEEQLRADIDKESKRKVEEMLIISTVMKTIEEKVSKDEIAKKVSEFSEVYNLEEDKVIEMIGGEDKIINEINYQKAYNKIIG